MCLPFWICRKLSQQSKASERGNPPSVMNHHPIRADRFRSGNLSLRGEGHDCIARHHMEGWKKERRMKRWRFPAHGCTRTEWPLWVSPAHGCTQLCHIFRFPLAVPDFCGGLGRTSREACSLSWTAIIISIDGFSVPPSISIPNYTVERSAVANNQINEFGYLDSIIASPSVCPTRTIILYLEIWAQTDGGRIPPWGRGSFLLSTERPHITAT